ATGMLSGVAAPGTVGTYPFTISASNGIGTSTQNFTLTVIAPAAVITSADHTTFTTGTSNSFPVTASQTAVFAKISGILPAGVTLSKTGVLSGTPTVGGVYHFTILATMGKVTSVQPFTLTVDQAPTVVPLAATFTVGVTSSFTIRTTGFPIAT